MHLIVYFISHNVTRILLVEWIVEYKISRDHLFLLNQLELIDQNYFDCSTDFLRWLSSLSFRELIFVLIIDFATSGRGQCEIIGSVGRFIGNKVKNLFCLKMNLKVFKKYSPIAISNYPIKMRLFFFPTDHELGGK